MTREATTRLDAGQTFGSPDIDEFMAARRRYAEDALAAAIARGATQYVVLGAGLDTVAWRSAPSRLRVFEVDHPVSPARSRRQRGGEAAIPSSVKFVPSDFEKQPLGSALQDSGFDDGEITFFSWLGVTPYPTAEAAMATLAFIGSRPEGSSVVFDYAVERSSLDSAWKMAMDAFASRVARVGEPSRMYLDPRALDLMLRSAGFQQIEDLGPADIGGRYFAGQRATGGFAHLVNAQV